MSRQSLVRFAALGAVLLLPLSALKCGDAEAGVAPTSYGPPFLSLEVPPNPMRPDTRDAAMLIRVFHHGSPAGYKIQGRAEGAKEHLLLGALRASALFCNTANACVRTPAAPGP